MNIRDVKWFKNKLWQNMDIGDVTWINQMTLKDQIRSYHSTRGRGYDFNTMDIRGVTWFETSYGH